MREILFRGKRVSDGKWIYGYYNKCEALHNWKDERPEPRTWIQEVDESGVALIFEPVDPATVGQFTGLTDKNGKKIFEGDILAMKGMEKLIIEGVVRYGTFNCTCCHGVYGWFVDGGDIRDAAYMCEVIGNIHDNPELLEVEK